MREMKKGSLGLLVLHLLYEQPSYGWELCERLRERSAGTLHFEDGAVYPLLHSYERDGLIEGYWETDDAPESAGRKGPRRRYYRLTASGVQALRATLLEWQTFSQAINQVLGEHQIAKDGGMA
jgi:PadR family transcriptional regulator, regulatory protein PadR